MNDPHRQDITSDGVDAPPVEQISETHYRYRGYEITSPPWGEASYHFEWSYEHADYDGPGDNRCGYANSVADCVDGIDDLEDE